MTADDLMRLIGSYTEACDDLGAGLFEQTAAETEAKHGKAKELHGQILAEVYRLYGDNRVQQRGPAGNLEEYDPRPCTCHPSDCPPQPCARRYALTDCREADRVWTNEVLRLIQRHAPHIPMSEHGDESRRTFLAFARAVMALGPNVGIEPPRSGRLE